MDMIGKIRRLHRRDKLSEREIARKTAPRGRIVAAPIEPSNWGR